MKKNQKNPELKMSKAQVSIEYMMVIGFATLMAIPLLAIYYTYSSDTSDSVATTQALQIARKIGDAAESVYYLGKPSQSTLRLNFPDNIESATMLKKEILFKMKTKQGTTDIAHLSSVNISGALPISQGIHIVTVKAEDDYVQITSN